MADVLQVQRRESLGSRATQKLRRSGHIPAVLYGHGEANEHLSVPMTDLKLVLRHHARTVELKGAVNETALVSSMQWDPLGIELMHVDLVRVNLQELVEVTLPLSVYGDAPGLREGGMLLENYHEITVKCPAGSIPESIQIDVNDLHLGQHKFARDVTLPPGVELVTPGDTVIVHIESPKGAAAEPVQA